MIHLQHGIPPDQVGAAAQLYWQAFGGKLGRVMGPDARALRYLVRIIQTDHAIAALHNGQLVGMIGFKTPQGSFADGTPADMRAYVESLRHGAPAMGPAQRFLVKRMEGLLEVASAN